MMAQLGKWLHNFPGSRTADPVELEYRVEAIEAQVDGIIARVDDLERLETEHRESEHRDGQ